MTQDLANANRAPAFFPGSEPIVWVMTVLRSDRDGRAASRPSPRPDAPARRPGRAVGGSGGPISSVGLSGPTPIGSVGSVGAGPESLTDPHGAGRAIGSAGDRSPDAQA